MRFYLLFLTCLFVSCQNQPRLQTGRWTGSLTPMNHPDISNPVAFEVNYRNDDLILSLVGPDSELIPAIRERAEGDSLFFHVKEPEQQILLKCAFGKQQSGEFAGRCTDSSGKWAQFTMVPPNMDGD